jgi:chromate transporter
MRQEPPATALAASDAIPAAMPGVLDLFLVFAKISLAGFGGVLIWTRRAIVEQHRWMTAEEFNETFALCHFLPGPNVVNLSLVFGSRFRGLAGGIAAFAGLLGPPMIIVTILAGLYSHFGEIPALRRTLAGVSCAAVGLLLSVMVRMMLPLARKRDWIGLTLLAAVFAAVGMLRLPLPIVLLIAVPVSIAVTFFTRRAVAT